MTETSKIQNYNPVSGWRGKIHKWDSSGLEVDAIEFGWLSLWSIAVMGWNTNYRHLIWFLEAKPGLRMRVNKVSEDMDSFHCRAAWTGRFIVGMDWITLGSCLIYSSFNIQPLEGSATSSLEENFTSISFWFRHRSWKVWTCVQVDNWWFMEHPICF